jgi:hypothetical protein
MHKNQQVSFEKNPTKDIILYENGPSRVGIR